MVAVVLKPKLGTSCTSGDTFHKVTKLCCTSGDAFHGEEGKEGGSEAKSDGGYVCSHRSHSCSVTFAWRQGAGHARRRLAAGHKRTKTHYKKNASPHVATPKSQGHSTSGLFFQCCCHSHSTQCLAAALDDSGDEYECDLLEKGVAPGYIAIQYFPGFPCTFFVVGITL